MYRYNEKRFTKSLLAVGNIRIGTLHDFRRSEHKIGIADPQEGKKTVSHHIDEFSSSHKNETDLKALKAMPFFQIESETSEIRDCTVGRNFSYPDLFVLCFSGKLSSETMAEFERADSCVEILDLKNFIIRITESITIFFPVKFLGYSRVVYGSRNEPWNGRDWGQHPVFLKETSYSKQYEHRAIWKPLREGPIEPFILCDCQLNQYCREVDVP